MYFDYFYFEMNPSNSESCRYKNLIASLRVLQYILTKRIKIAIILFCFKRNIRGTLGRLNILLFCHYFASLGKCIAKIKSNSTKIAG